MQSIIASPEGEAIQSNKQLNPLEGLVKAPSQQTNKTEELITPAIKGKSKMDEVAEAAINIFGGRELNQQS